MLCIIGLIGITLLFQPQRQKNINKYLGGNLKQEMDEVFYLIAL